MGIIDIRNLEKYYYIENGRTMKRNKVEVIRNISLQIAKNESLCIMGKSGCGKTTLLKMLGTLIEPSRGGVYYKGIKLSDYDNESIEAYRRTKVGFVFQDYKLLGHLTIRDNIILPLMLDHQKVKTSLQKVESMADMFQIGDKLDCYPNELSGGEKQRAAIGRALINSPEIILADEPTGNLDSASSEIVMELLVKLQRELNKTLVIVTHDVEVSRYCNRTIKILDGKIREC